MKTGYGKATPSAGAQGQSSGSKPKKPTMPKAKKPSARKR